jgi:hypothetical protein
MLKQVRRIMLAGLISLMAMTIVGPPPAGATTWSQTAGFPMAGFIRAPAAPFWCASGYIGVRDITVIAPGNYNVNVYAIASVQRWNGSSWTTVTYGDGNMALVKNGLSVAAGTSRVFPGRSWATPAGYYHFDLTVMFISQAPSNIYLGTVVISASSAGDYQSGAAGSNFCYHS